MFFFCDHTSESVNVKHLRPKSSESGTRDNDAQAPDVVCFGFELVLI